MLLHEVNQNRIYENDFRAKMNLLHRVQAASCVNEPSAGYLVAWLYSDALMEKVAEVNGRINQIVPTIRFGKGSAHTTITVYQKQPLASFKINRQTLTSLTEACNNLDTQLLQAVQIDFKEWLFNQEAFIAAGQPNDPFWQVGEALQAAGKARGLTLRMPWGAHMTVGRFLTPSGNVNDLNKLAQQTPTLRLCNPCAIVISHYKAGPSAFELHPYALHEIRHAYYGTENK